MTVDGWMKGMVDDRAGSFNLRNVYVKSSRWEGRGGREESVNGRFW